MAGSEIALTTGISDYFQPLLAEVLRARRVEASEAATSYLVGVLCEFARPDADAEATFEQPLTFLLRDASESVGAERFRRLRRLGDHVLYAVGFFGEHIERRGVDRKYAVSVGSSAYQGASAMLREPKRASLGTGDVLMELATKFARFSEALADIAEGALFASARDERSVVRMYERWLETGSTRLAEELGARGILARRGPVASG